MGESISMGEILMKQLLIVTVVFFVAGCGTMYDLPKYGESELARAQLLMVEGQSTGGRSKPLIPTALVVDRFGPLSGSD